MPRVAYERYQWDWCSFLTKSRKCSKTIGNRPQYVFIKFEKRNKFCFRMYQNKYTILVKKNQVSHDVKVQRIIAIISEMF